ncbi:MAG: hypothetical protein LBK28_04160 [Propionibacteriaceae bacterium]|jgi:hypothetical protein|nr:hypothetical protein [Propionibacteriaceae bacterium]
MKKSLYIPAVAFAVTASLVATPAVAAQTPEQIDQTVATRAQLTEIVSAQVAQVYATLTAPIHELVAGTVETAIGNPDAIIALSKPLIKAKIKSTLAQYIQDPRLDSLVDQAVDSVAESELLSYVLNNSEFVDAVLDRTVDYAVAGVFDSVGLTADREATVASVVAKVWNAPLVSVGTAPT